VFYTRRVFLALSICRLRKFASVRPCFQLFFSGFLNPSTGKDEDALVGLPWVPEDIFFLSILLVRGEAGLTRKKITSGHRSTQPHFHVRNQFRILIGYSNVKLFDVANQGHYYIVNSPRTWEYPIGDPVQILN